MKTKRSVGTKKEILAGESIAVCFFSQSFALRGRHELFEAINRCGYRLSLEKDIWCR